jgi:DNA-binding response OmpR family regulator
MKKVLVIDDNADILDAIQLMLASHGYDTDATAIGEEAYHKVDLYQPDVIILDVLLSGVDGRVICSNLKQKDETQNIPVIMISAHPSAMEGLNACQADAYVAKPFSISELLGVVERFAN